MKCFVEGCTQEGIHEHAPEGILFTNSTGPDQAREFEDRSLRFRIATLEAENASLNSEIESMRTQIQSLSRHGTWDTLQDICLHHSPMLSAAMAENAKLNNLIADADVCGEIGAACPWCDARSYVSGVPAQHTEWCEYEAIIKEVKR